MLLRTLLAISLLSCLPTSAAFLFTDNFSGEAPGGIPHSTFANWTVLQGTVDVIDCGGGDYCVDLDGTGGDEGAIFETTQLHSEGGTQYTLGFSFAGGIADDLTVSVGSVFTQNLGTAYGVTSAYTYNFTPVSTTTAKIRFTVNDAPNFFGPYLTAVSLSDDGSTQLEAVPEPGSILLVASGIAASVIARARRS